MTARTSNFANAFETTLTAQMGSTDLTATVATTTGGPASPCYLVIEPGVPSRREYVFFDGTFTSTAFVTSALANRYLDGSAAVSGITHPSGSEVHAVPSAQAFEDLHDRVDELDNDLDGHTHSNLYSTLTHNHDSRYARVATGNYNGTGSTITFTIGFTPSMVTIIGPSAGVFSMGFATPGFRTDPDSTSFTLTETADTRPEIITNGFRVRGADVGELSRSGLAYYYVAIG